jgi:hypothetical protein
MYQNILRHKGIQLERIHLKMRQIFNCYDVNSTEHKYSVGWRGSLKNCVHRKRREEKGKEAEERNVQQK